MSAGLCDPNPAAVAAGNPIDGDPNSWNMLWSKMRGQQNQCLYVPIDRPCGGINEKLLRAYYRLLRQAVPNDKPRKCLELGAGRGTTSQYLAADGDEVTLVDLSEAGFRMAVENWQRFEMPLPTFWKSDVRWTNLDAGSFDIVHSVGLLEHFRDPVPVLLESDRLLAPGGTAHHIIISDADGRNNDFDRHARHNGEWLQMSPPGAVCRNTIFRGVQELFWSKP